MDLPKVILMTYEMFQLGSNFVVKSFLNFGIRCHHVGGIGHRRGRSVESSDEEEGGLSDDDLVDFIPGPHRDHLSVLLFLVLQNGVGGSIDKVVILLQMLRSLT